MTVRALRESIDEAKDMLRADFANKSIGGGSIAHGCVQVRQQPKRRSRFRSRKVASKRRRH